MNIKQTSNFNIKKFNINKNTMTVILFLGLLSSISVLTSCSSMSKPEIDPLRKNPQIVFQDLKNLDILESKVIETNLTKN